MKAGQSTEPINVTELIEKYDTEARYRKYTGIMALIIAVIAIAMSFFQLYTAGFGLLESVKQRAVHLFFVLVLVFLLYPARNKTRERKLPTVVDLLWLVAGVASIGYLILQWDSISLAGGLLETRDYIFGAIGIVVVFEASRRVLGKGLTIVALVFMLYTFFGHLIPGPLGHREFSLERIIEHMFFLWNGRPFQHSAWRIGHLYFSVHPVWRFLAGNRNDQVYQ